MIVSIAMDHVEFGKTSVTFLHTVKKTKLFYLNNSV